MNRIAVNLEDLPEALDTNEHVVRKAIGLGALAGAHRGRALIIRKTPTDQGQLRASWKVRPGTMEFDGAGETLAELINDAPHISVVELGAKPHAISPEAWTAIYEWVRRHYRTAVGGGAAKNGGVYVMGGAGKMVARSKSRVTGPYKGDDPRIEYITNAIAFKIRKYGQKATLFVRNSVDDLRDVMGYELNRAIGVAISKMRAERGIE